MSEKKESGDEMQATPDGKSKSSESPSTEPVNGVTENPYPRDGQFHVRFNKAEWETLRLICQRRNMGISEATNYLCRYYETYPVDLKLAFDRLHSVEAHTKLLNDHLEGILRGVEELEMLMATPAAKTESRASNSSSKT